MYNCLQNNKDKFPSQLPNHFKHSRRNVNSYTMSTLANGAWYKAIQSMAHESFHDLSTMKVLCMNENH